MANIKTWWYNLVAKRLVTERDDLQCKLNNQLGITKQHVDQWIRADQRVTFLQEQVDILQRELANAQTRVEMTQDLKMIDRRAVVDIVRERLGMDDTLPGKLDLLRQQLKQELAYIVYLEENQVDGTTPFNKLPLDKRKIYFERVEGQVR